MRTSTSLQFNAATECNKENQAATPSYFQGICNPGLQDTPKHRPLSAVAASYVRIFIATYKFRSGNRLRMVTKDRACRMQRHQTLRQKPTSGCSKCSKRHYLLAIMVFNKTLRSRRRLMLTRPLQMDRCPLEQLPFNKCRVLFPPIIVVVSKIVEQRSCHVCFTATDRVAFTSPLNIALASYSSDYACGPPPQQPPPPLPPSANASVLAPASYYVPVTMNGHTHESVAAPSQAAVIPPANVANNPSPGTDIITSRTAIILRRFRQRYGNEARRRSSAHSFEKVVSVQPKIHRIPTSRGG